ncbi:MAG: hypothetical protein ACR2MA_12185 [Egibacteraceae bacterium]
MSAEANPDAGDLAVLVALADGVDVAAGRRAIEGALADLPTVRVDDSQDIKDQVAEGVNQLLGLLGALSFFLPGRDAYRTTRCRPGRTRGLRELLRQRDRPGGASRANENAGQRPPAKHEPG